ncbi:MAG TPA: hypothetical protein HA349_08040 [Methanotrichaceae archaeon]|nr:hypothetical protein [Methanotrichaceae archaeon]
MTANNFSNHLDGYISRIISGLKPSKPEVSSISHKKDVLGVFETMEWTIMNITPLLRRGEANV